MSLYSLLRKLDILNSDVSMRKSGDFYEVNLGGQRLVLSEFYAATVARCFNEWKKYYLPKDRADTVLCIGAGEGETPALFFENGAKKVVAIESNHNAIERLRLNSAVNGWDIDIYEKRFDVVDLEIPHDFMQMNIPAAKELLKAEKLGLCSIAVSPEREGMPLLHAELCKKFGLVIAMSRYQLMEKTHFYILRGI